MGKLNVTFIETGVNTREDYSGVASMIYPHGFYNRRNLELWFNMFVAKNWINPEGEIETNVVWSPEKTYDGSAIPISIITHNRFEPPTIIINNKNATLPFVGMVDPNIPSDSYVEWVYGTQEVIGIKSFHRSYAYVNSNHDDYILIEQTFLFDGDIDDDPGQDVPDQTIDFAWFDALSLDIPMEAASNTNRTGWSSGHGWATWDSYKNYMGQELLVKDKDRDDLLISYFYSEDHIQQTAPKGYSDEQVSKYYDLKGVPDPKTGMFLAPQYGGIAILHADKSASDSEDDINKPKSLQYMWHSKNFWGKSWDYDFWKFVVDPELRPKEQWIEENFPYNETSVENVFLVQGVGPYSLSIGDVFSCVYAIGFGSINEDLCSSEGAKWYNWYWDLPGEKLDDAGKNALISQGKDSLFVNLDRAYWAFNRDFDIPDPLPAPDIEVTGGPDRIEIKRWIFNIENSHK